MTVALSELLRRAGVGLKFETAQLFKPSLIYSILKDPFSVWAEFHAPVSERSAPDLFSQKRMEAGKAHEAELLKRNYPEMQKLEGTGEQAAVKTLQLMSQGVRVIGHPQLWDLNNSQYGQADLIVRCDDAGSDLGEYHYRVREIKSSANLSDHHVLQATFYNRVLSKIQGFNPRFVEIVLKNGVEVVDTAAHGVQLDQAIKAWRYLKLSKTPPDYAYSDNISAEWASYARKLLEQRRDVSLIAGFTAKRREKIRKAFGVDTIDGVGGLSEQDLVKALGKDGIKLHKQAQAYVQRKILLADGKPVSIPKGKRTVFWDVEDSNDEHPSEPPHVYLIGVLEDGKYKAFGGRGSASEKKSISDFLDYIGDPTSVLLLQWSGYETTTIRRVAERHSGLADTLNALSARTVDLYRQLKGKLFFPLPSNSIKDIGPYCGYRWRGQVEGGLDAMARYWDYLDSGSADLWDEIVRYNEDDCRAMEVVLTQLVTNGFVTTNG